MLECTLCIADDRQHLGGGGEEGMGEKQATNPHCGKISHIFEADGEKRAKDRM